MWERGATNKQTNKKQWFACICLQKCSPKQNKIKQNNKNSKYLWCSLFPWCRYSLHGQYQQNVTKTELGKKYVQLEFYKVPSKHHWKT